MFSMCLISLTLELSRTEPHRPITTYNLPEGRRGPATSQLVTWSSLRLLGQYLGLTLMSWVSTCLSLSFMYSNSIHWSPWC